MLTVFGAAFLLLIFTEPSNRSSGRIFGIELPPMRVIPKEKFDQIDRDRFYVAFSWIFWYHTPFTLLITGFEEGRKLKVLPCNYFVRGTICSHMECVSACTVWSTTKYAIFLVSLWVHSLIRCGGTPVSWPWMGTTSPDWHEFHDPLDPLTEIGGSLQPPKVVGNWEIIGNQIMLYVRWPSRHYVFVTTYTIWAAVYVDSALARVPAKRLQGQLTNNSS